MNNYTADIHIKVSPELKAMFVKVLRERGNNISRWFRERMMDLIKESA